MTLCRALVWLLAIGASLAMYVRIDADYFMDGQEAGRGQKIRFYRRWVLGLLRRRVATTITSVCFRCSMHMSKISKIDVSNISLWIGTVNRQQMGRSIRALCFARRQ